ncbi:MAG: Fe-S cluster assembly protein SufD [Solirubrobacteraceae bacterium]|nr:Fe-S cluster assembly protein SufD [Solirubrobacteraceae bacterium]
MTQVATPAEPTSVFLDDRRAAAAERVRSIDLPSFRGRTGWEYTSLEKLDLSLPVALGGDPSLAPSVPEIEGASIVLTQVGDQVSIVGEAPEGVTVSTLADAAVSHPEVVEQFLGTIVDEEDPFVARAESLWTGGAFVHVPRGVQASEPIALRLHQDRAGHQQAFRVLVVVEDGARAEVRELWDTAEGVSGGGIVYPVTELVVGQNAHLRYLSVQELDEQTWILGSQRAAVARDANLDWAVLGLGGGGGRIHLDAALDGEGAEARITGAYATRSRQHLDYATKQIHAAPRTVSDLAFRGILNGRSTAVWSGMIEVVPGAQKIDAFQESRNLLVSKKAHADAIPGLEILANDVRCTHAAAIAQLDEAQLFYLRSRGLPEAAAKRLVIEGFLQATVSRFDEGSFRELVAGALDRRLAEVLG